MGHRQKAKKRPDRGQVEHRQWERAMRRWQRAGLAAVSVEGAVERVFHAPYDQDREGA